MKKYYPAKEVKFIERNEVIDKLKDADNTPTKHIRIIFNDKKKKISFYNDEEYDILQAVVFLWTRNSLLRYDFDADEEAGKHLCIATRPDEYMAIALKDGECIAEGLSQFDDNDRILAMIHVEEETFFVAYDGNASKVGYGYFAEEEDRPSIFDMLNDLFEADNAQLKMKKD